MASGSSTSHEMRGNLVNAEGEAARPSTEHLQEIQHDVSPAMQPSSMLVSVVVWLFGFIHSIWGVLGAVVAWLQVTEHEEANGASNVLIHEPVVNDESTAFNDGGRDIGDSEHILEPRQKVFLSHSGVQKDFVEQLCVDLQRWDRYPFFDKLRSSLPIGEKFPKRIFDAIERCHVGVVVLSEEFFMSKWPMLELNAMVKKYKESKSRMTIIPVFYSMFVNDMKDLKNRKRWLLKWKELANNDKRIHVDEWIECIRILESINGLVMKEGMGDVKFREEIVQEVCGKTPCETRWDDSHVQGRQRSCEVIQAKMTKVGTTSRVSVVGLYGVGGIGKTTICKALCNELSPKFGDFVCHVELGSGSELEMIQKALKKLANIEHDIINKLDDVDQGYAYLYKSLASQQVFLALDNVQDNYNSLKMAQSFLKAHYRLGSVVLVCARSLDALKMVNLNESQCLEMPELKEDEARSLFLDYTNILACGYDVDEVLVKHCLGRCHFLKGDGKSKHYHPLALKVLGQQFGSDSTLWEAQLMKIDTFNRLGDMEHPVFSIFKNSYNSLNNEQQLLFMHLAILREVDDDVNFLHILCTLHEERNEDMMDMLEVLRQKSMLDEIGWFDGFREIEMHDLWREFAAVQVKTQDLRDQRCIYQVDERRGALRRRGLCRESVESMYFQNWGWKGLDGLKLDEFVNVTALMLEVEISMVNDKLNLDLSGLKQLKVLNVRCPGLPTSGNGVSSLRSLFYLTWRSPGISPCFNEIGCLTKLQYLYLWEVKGVEVLDLTRLEFLRSVRIIELPDLITVRGLSSRLANLQTLYISSCMSLRECPDLGEVYSLATIIITDCGILEVLPDLGRLSNLRKLNILRCKSLRAVSGFGGLVSLENLMVMDCANLVTVLDMGRLTMLQELGTRGCPVQGLPRLDGLISLTKLSASFGEICREQPLFSNLSALKHVEIEGWNGNNLWKSIQSLPMLEKLILHHCRGDDVVPDLQNLKKLNWVILFACNFRDLSGLSNVTALEVLCVDGCDRLESFPKFERPTKLIGLGITRCNNLRVWPSASNLCSLVFLRVDTVSLTKIIPDLEKLTSLQDLMLCVEGCENVLSMAFLSQLEALEVYGCPRIRTLDLSNYLQLRVLVLSECSALERVTCGTPLGALMEMDVRRCECLVELPDLSLFPKLEEVSVRNCSALKGLTCSRSLTALEEMTLIGCGSLLEELVDVSKFPKLVRFRRVDAIHNTDYDNFQRQFRRLSTRRLTLAALGFYKRE